MMPFISFLIIRFLRLQIKQVLRLGLKDAQRALMVVNFVSDLLFNTATEYVKISITSQSKVCGLVCNITCEPDNS
jgi:hypothetical protein